MLSLKKITIKNYKCFIGEHSFIVDNGITILVGKNESGKTAVLEAIAKTNNVSQNDDSMQFDVTNDYPRSLRKQYQKTNKNDWVVKCSFSVSKELKSQIKTIFGTFVTLEDNFERTTRYDNSNEVTPYRVDEDKFWTNKLKSCGLKATSEIISAIIACNSSENFIKLCNELKESDESLSEQYSELANEYTEFFEFGSPWDNTLSYYVYRKFILPNIPKYLYYDEFYSLPGLINLTDFSDGHYPEEQKTINAFFELAGVNIDILTESDDFEGYISELEAAASDLSKSVFKYWKTNSNLKIRFMPNQRETAIDKSKDKNAPNNKRIVKFLNVRVEDVEQDIILPLRNRSRGFNWFFSFIIWFSKIQYDRNAKYILLLDEPGLNLHASAQRDLVCFIKDLAKEYQIIYSTHSPFMIDVNSLSCVRTVKEQGTKGAMISETVQEKDADTLFPLQAALGYDIAQNLFISKYNLLVEGIADISILSYISSMFEAHGRIYLNSGIVLVPTGGLDKVSTFISLFKGQKLHMACLLDSFDNQKGKQRLEDLIKHKIIKEKQILFYSKYAPCAPPEADLEDIFEKDLYLKYYNITFKKKISVKDLKSTAPRITKQLAELNGGRYNHYLPIQTMITNSMSIDELSERTITAFEAIFKDVNSLLFK